MLNQTIIKTKIGNIAVYVKKNESTNTPLIFLHGVYFNHHLWDKFVNEISERTVIVIDMPLHGNSKLEIKKDWSLDDCAEMLIDILNYLNLKEVIAIGHSWGSMTILRAATKYPSYFFSIGLCNMPYKRLTLIQRFLFHLQHLFLPLRNFYTKQTANYLFASESLKNDPKLFYSLKNSMDMLSSKQIRLIDKRVILDANDASNLIDTLTVRKISVVGEKDYVAASKKLNTRIIKGGHISPLEDPSYISYMISELVKNN